MKRKIIFGSLSISIAVFLFIIFTLVVIPSIELVGGDEYILGAHRGNSQDFTENTLEAFQSAINDSKYQFIEFDIQYTKDKKIIVYHDTSLLRLQEKLDDVCDLTYDEILNASDYHIPLYSEVMEITAGKKPLNIEIKSQGNFKDDKLLADFIISDLNERGIARSTLVSSVSGSIVKYIKEKENSENIQTGLIYYVTPSTFVHYDDITLWLYEKAEDSSVDYLMLHGANLRNYDSLKKMKPENVSIVFWYFNDEMYLVKPKPKSWVFRLKTPLDQMAGKAETQDSRGDCIWWCN